MKIFNVKIKSNKKILALGAEFDTTLSYYHQGKIIISDNLENSATNIEELEKKINTFCKNLSIIPDIIITDLHPEYNSTKIGTRLAKQWDIPHIQVQHHHAHIFSSIVENYLLVNDKNSTSNNLDLPEQIIGIACDGTGYGLDNTIWGGEIMVVESKKLKVKSIKRIGYLENQTLLGGELAVEEPARMLISILNKFLTEQEMYSIIKRFYDQQTFKLLYSQLNQNFNCEQTSSCARILDATSALLFDINERKSKHYATKILENKATEAYNNIAPAIEYNNNSFILKTTPLFEYLIKNLDKDKNRLAGTAHKYLADGLYQIVNNYSQRLKEVEPPNWRFNLNEKTPILFSGGMANNKHFKKFFLDKSVLINKKIPSGDSGISIGQIGYFLLFNKF